MSTKFVENIQLKGELKLPFYFISDVHIHTILNEKERDKRRALFILFDKMIQSGGTLFILGDFFDFWFDFGSDYPDSLRDIINQLRKLKESGMVVHIIGGNHDYWLEGYLTEQLGLLFYPDKITFSFEGKTFYLIHGDGLLKDDWKYRIMKKVLRSSLAIWGFRQLGIEKAYEIGQNVSKSGRVKDDKILAKLKNDADEMLDFLKMKTMEGIDIAIMGHIHFPVYKQSGNAHYLILGDWTHQEHRNYAIWDGSTLMHHSELKENK